MEPTTIFLIAVFSEFDWKIMRTSTLGGGQMQTACRASDTIRLLRGKFLALWACRKNFSPMGKYIDSSGKG
jgi:hypothetical protein